MLHGSYGVFMGISGSFRRLLAGFRGIMQAFLEVSEGLKYVTWSFSVLRGC